MTPYDKVKAWRQSQPNIRQIRAAEAKRWREKHPEIYAEIRQRYRAKNTEQIRERDRLHHAARRVNDPEGQKRRSQAYLQRQAQKREEIAGRPKPELCEICGELNIRIVFDHCHRRGHFRGWICDRCNRVLGLVKDSPKLLSLLQKYLTVTIQ
jgi:Recombination endonuclease VII